MRSPQYKNIDSKTAHKLYRDKVNKILETCGVEFPVRNIKECSPSMFIIILERLFDLKHLRGVIRSPTCADDHISNAAHLLHHVQSLLGYDLNIEPIDLYQREPDALCDMIDVFLILEGLVKYLARSTESGSSSASSLLSSSDTFSRSSYSESSTKPSFSSETDELPQRGFQKQFDMREDRKLKSLYNRTVSELDLHSRRLKAENLRTANRLHSKRMHDMRVRDIQAAKDEEERIRLLEKTRRKMRSQQEQFYREMYAKIQKLEKERILEEKAAMRQQQKQIKEEVKQRRQQIATFYEQQIDCLREEFLEHRQQRQIADKELRWTMERNMRELRHKRREHMKREHERLLSEEDAQFHQQKREMEKYADRIFSMS